MCALLSGEAFAIDEILDAYDTLRATLATVTAEREALREAAYDIECAVRERWGWPDVHPANQRKYERDMELVTELKAHADAL